jgi:hypothetical protein
VEAGGVTGDGFVERVIVTEHPQVGQDLVGLDPPTRLADLPPALVARVDAHRRALERGDVARAEEDVTDEARASVGAVYAALEAPLRDSAVVAAARIGDHRIVRLRLTGPRVASIVQLHWRQVLEGWRVLGAELVRTEPLA